LSAKVLLIDGYIDEPASLGVPPYSSPHIRAAVGAAREGGADATLVTIDRVREGRPLPKADLVAVLAGCAVPGRYLRGMPASIKEIRCLAQEMKGFKVLGGPAAYEIDALSDLFDFVAKRDAPAAIFDILRKGEATDRWRTLEEWNRWLLLGADCVTGHPDFPQPLIAEIETYRGCVRYRSGGCSFCVEPLKGRPLFREPEDVIAEAARLRSLGVRNFRLGAQTCFISYKSETNGTETPRPNPEAIEVLLKGVRSLDVDVLHLDNANPAVIAKYPHESRRILRSIVEHCTSGNVLALGMESADPRVVEANNLNAEPDQVLAAIRLINDVGRERGPTGLPYVLPGLNFIIGLDGESDDTLRLNLEFLRKVRGEGLLLRRINIRQVMAVRREFKPTIRRSKFFKFKETVREEIDSQLLRELVPIGTRLTGIYTELKEGKHTFGRQIGTYPLLVGFNYPIELGRFVDCKVVDWGFRSITAVESPLDINACPIAALESLPSIGNKRAVRIVRSRPFRKLEEVGSVLDDPGLADKLAEFVTLR